MSGGLLEKQPKDPDARRAVAFMVAKFAMFAVAPVIVAGLIVYFTLPA
ncbi:MAG: hypothetical protein MUC37_00800 [Hyphomicrobium sp.]|jgi:hypothetical protein|nr:hypothetical protein [Hyphomicrobium sp.]